ncbi:MAG: SpoIIE family protein phosphatase [Firmicutes bacterium]|nr:SpoIIE family protein phosphatase [Bacillota bacterium]
MKEDFSKIKDYKKLKILVKYLGLTIVYYALFSSPLIPEVFAYSAYVCAGFLLLNPIVCFVLFAVIGGALNFSTDFLLGALLSAFLFLALYMVLKTFKKKVNVKYFLALVLICSLTNLINIQTGQDVLDVFINCGYVFLSVAVILNALKVIILRRKTFNMTTDETVCFCIILIAVFAGISNIQLFNVSIIIIFGVFLTLLILFSCPKSYALAFSALIGLSAALIYGYQFIGLFILYALVALIFKDVSKYLSALSVVLAEILLAYYFNFYAVYNYVNLIFVVFSCLIFILIPKKFFERVSSKFSYQNSLSRIIVNRNRRHLYLKILEISDVFSEMENVFNKMQKGYLTKDSASQMLSKECFEKNCPLCENFHKCQKNKDQILSGILSGIDIAIEKGSITMIDISSDLSKNCANLPKMINVFKQYALSYRQYVAVMKKMDSTKKLIGKQLGGVSKVIKELSLDVKGGVNFDFMAEKGIIDELLFNNIICLEAVIYSENEQPVVSLILDRDSEQNPNIAKLVSGVLKRPMNIYLKEEAENKNNVVVFLKPAPKFDVIFGAAGCPKYPNELSGDTHSMVRLSDEKFLIALCDGMGSGEAAENMSSSTISLIENFYKSGLNSKLILDSVNSLLTVNADEIFAALDICVCDLNKGKADFIKLGAPQSYVKNPGKTEVVLGNSLPMGILEETSPSVSSFDIENKSIIVLCTDGVYESFKDNGLRELINDFENLNPQELAELILSTALTACNNRAKDDMTVLTLRIFSKI